MVWLFCANLQAPRLEAFLSKRGEIEQRLTKVAVEENVRVLFAVESGSRAWGHPSPDSDYDVRFVYVHPLEWYLTLAPGRDVIEYPIEDDVDLSGWDLKKSLALLIKPNPVLLEWLSSPIRYVWDEDICSRLISLAAGTEYARACHHHYRSLAESQFKKHISDRLLVNLTKYFYVLRPSLVLRWIRLNPDSLPPMNLTELIQGCHLESEQVDEIDKLLTLKAQAKESGEGLRIRTLDLLIEREIEASHDPGVKLANRQPKADQLFASIVMNGSGSDPQGAKDC